MPRPGGGQRPSRRGRARHDRGVGARRAAADPAGGERAVPLRPDVAGGRGNEGGACRNSGRGAGGAADRQRHRVAGQRSRRDPQSSGRAGDVAGALARKRPGDEGTRRHRAGRNRLRQGADRALPSASIATSRSPMSRRRPISTRWRRRSKTPVMFDLSGKSALVTGASGGIGASIAKALHGAGASVVLSGTRVDGARSAARRAGRARLCRARRPVASRLGRDAYQERRASRWFCGYFGQ